MTMRCLLTSLTLAWIAGMTWIGAAAAQDYPTRPITLVVPQAPGGGNDVIARIIAEHEPSARSADRRRESHWSGRHSRHATSRKECTRWLHAGHGQHRNDGDCADRLSECRL